MAISTMKTARSSRRIPKGELIALPVHLRELSARPPPARSPQGMTGPEPWSNGDMSPLR